MLRCVSVAQVSTAFRLGAEEAVCGEINPPAGREVGEQPSRQALERTVRWKGPAARQAGFANATTVANLVERFNQRGLDALGIGSGRGRKPTYAADARAQIVALAQRPPERTADGTASWSLSTLQRTLRREALPAVGATTIRRVLQDAGSSYQRTRTWCPTGTAQRQRKAGVVTVTDPKTEEKRG
ncbi:MAG: helix-turn-helix domain-containing protein [Dehalococcoidia bacterium]